MVFRRDDQRRAAGHRHAAVRRRPRRAGPQPPEARGGRSRDGAGWRCRLADTLTGAACEVEARCVVNAAGPWAGSFAQSRARLRPTKGIHLVFPRERLPVQCAVVLTEGPRILFTIPWGERTYVGTTDTDYAGPLESPRVEPADTAYLLDALARAFPAAGVTAADLLASWAGLRPLVRKRDGSPSDISRSTRSVDGGNGWFDVTGGKLTKVYRLMAEQTVDRVVRRSPRAKPRPAVPPASSARPRAQPGGSAAARRGPLRPLRRHRMGRHLRGRRHPPHRLGVLFRMTLVANGPAGGGFYCLNTEFAAATFARRCAGLMVPTITLLTAGLARAKRRLSSTVAAA
ncbi:MAG: FAD-dependent oxidoreductase [Kiritimatiellia bacterium]